MIFFSLVLPLPSKSRIWPPSAVFCRKLEGRAPETKKTSAEFSCLSNKKIRLFFRSFFLNAFGAIDYLETGHELLAGGN
mgnify:CR=1 FL=1